MFISGTSTHKVGEVVQTLMGAGEAVPVLLVVSITRLPSNLKPGGVVHYRAIGASSRLYGIHFAVRHGDRVDSTVVVAALGVDLEGNKEILGIRACAQESEDGWTCLLQDLRTRGATEVDLILTDGHDGLLAAVSALFPASARQRCLVHKQRNVMNAIRQQRARAHRR